MMKSFFKSILLVLLAGNTLNIMAQSSTNISLPAIFSDGIVLQQCSEVPVWGWGGASSIVKAVGSWNPKDTASAEVDNNGRWKLKLPTQKYGGPYTVDIFYAGATKPHIILKDVLIGEVWLCSGQSNMEWTPNNGISNKEEEIKNAKYPNLRYFSLPKRGSETLQDDCSAIWENCTPEVMSKRSATAYFFGKKLQEELGVPVGLIVSAWGGTGAEVWIPEEIIKEDKALYDSRLTTKYKWWPNDPGLLYNSMIHPLIPYDIAGVIWYQGESNRYNASIYSSLITQLVQSWRKEFDKNLPFYQVQIAPYAYDDVPDGAALIREAQEESAASIPNAGIAITIDKGVTNNIHPPYKQEVGDRLAKLALGKHYKTMSEGFESPFFKKMDIVKNKVIIEFTNSENGLNCPDKNINGLQIAGEDKKFIPAKGIIKGNTLVVSASAVKHPVAVRYCFDNTTFGNLFNGYGLPVAPFRTDKK